MQIRQWQNQSWKCLKPICGGIESRSRSVGPFAIWSWFSFLPAASVPAQSKYRHRLCISADFLSRSHTLPSRFSFFFFDFARQLLGHGSTRLGPEAAANVHTCANFGVVWLGVITLPVTCMRIFEFRGNAVKWGSRFASSQCTLYIKISPTDKSYFSSPSNVTRGRFFRHLSSVQ